MNKRTICFVGNSHLAALKLGWESCSSQYAEVSVDFFGSQADDLNELDWNGNSLVARSPRIRSNMAMTSGGMEGIVPESYRYVILCALGFGIHPLIATYAAYRSYAHREYAAAAYLTSEECLDESAFGVLESTTAISIIKKLKYSGVKVFLVPQPFPSIDIVRDSEATVWKTMYGSQDIERELVRYSRATEKLVEKYGFIIMEQPGETICGQMFTKSQYSRGSVRLTENFDVPHPEADRFHMNVGYGELVVENVIEAVIVNRS